MRYFSYHKIVQFTSDYFKKGSQDRTQNRTQIMPPKKTIKASAENLILFTQDELNYFEQKRREAYSKYEKSNPQFKDKNYDSWVKGQLEGGQAHTTISKRALWAATGYDQSVANNCIKDFIQSGNLKHVLNVIEVLNVKAFNCPVVKEIIIALNIKYSISLWMGNKKTGTLVKGLFQDIGLQLLIDSTQTIKPNKAKFTVRRLQDKLSQIYKREYSIEDTLQHINNIYRRTIEKLRKEPVYQHGAEKHITIKNIKLLLLKTEDKLKNAKVPETITDLNDEIKELNGQLKELEHIEDKLYKQARKLTIQYLEKDTGIKLGSTYFKNLLSMANTLS